ncbi:hypothetical protein BJQ90_01822 [Arthrobacter sp. SO3]|nr:hypothetical protein [Arthrobacter sp. SO3]
MPTTPAASPANDFDSAKSLMATASTVAANGLARSNAITISHHRRAHVCVFSHGMSIRATGATAASTMSAKDRKIIEHIRMNARTQTTITAMTVTTTAPAAPPLDPGAKEMTFQSLPAPAGAFSKPKSLMNSTYGSVPREPRSAADAESLTLVSWRTKYTAPATMGTAAAPPTRARTRRRGCWLIKPDNSWRIMATTRGVIMTTTHQLVSPSTAVHCESSTSEKLNAPVMKDQIQEAVF